MRFLREIAPVKLTVHDDRIDRQDADGGSSIKLADVVAVRFRPWSLRSGAFLYTASTRMPLPYSVSRTHRLAADLRRRLADCQRWQVAESKDFVQFEQVALIADAFAERFMTDARIVLRVGVLTSAMSFIVSSQVWELPLALSLSWMLAGAAAALALQGVVARHAYPKARGGLRRRA